MIVWEQRPLNTSTLLLSPILHCWLLFLPSQPGLKRDRVSLVEDLVFVLTGSSGEGPDYQLGQALWCWGEQSGCFFIWTLLCMATMPDKRASLIHPL